MLSRSLKLSKRPDRSIRLMTEGFMDSSCDSRPPAGTWRGAIIEGKGVET
jgi:hypothetical protein